VTTKKLFGLFVLLLPLLIGLSLAPAPLAAQDTGTPTPVATPTTTPTTNSDNSLLENLAADGRFTSLVTLVEAAGLAPTLDGPGLFTVFAPINSAFDDFDADDLPATVNLTEVLLYHVVNGNYPATAVANQDDFTTLLGSHMAVSTSDGVSTLDNSATVIGSIPSANGVIHVIDQILVPGRVGTGATAVDDDDADTTGADTTPDATDDETEVAAVDQSVTAVLQADGRFNTLLAVLNAAGLTDALLSQSDFTLFAPTDAAFAKLPEAFVNDLLADPQDSLDNILLYHVVGDSLSLNQVATDTWITTLEGRPILVRTNEAIQIFLNGDSRVIGGDIQVTNGVVHVIDTVLVP
jgi:transforming growth factor-beta-induced protein